MHLILSKAYNFFFKGHERSLRVKRNIIGLIIIRFVNIAVSFLLVPLTIHYVDKTQYGIWLTLSSIIGWMSFFDIGLSNGLRNKFAQAKARGDDIQARKYVSTTYALLSIIFIPILFISLFFCFKINWSNILKVDISAIQSFSYVALIVFTYFCLKFILSTINIIITADQRPAEASIRSLIEQIGSLIVIFLLTKTTKGSLLSLSLALCTVPIFVLVLFNISLFQTRYKKYAPNLHFVDLKLAPDLFGLGVKFFIIQISGIIKYQTGNIIIIRSFGPDEVTNFNIAYKYFGILPMVWSIFATPIWSAVTEAFENNDLVWIRNVEKKMRILTLVLGLAGAIMLILSNQIYDIWIGKNVVHITILMSVCAFLYNITKVYGGTYVQILNGLGYLKVQYTSTIIALIIFVISVYIMIKILHLGPYSVLVAATISNFNAYLLAPYQYKQIFIRKKEGIWAK